MTKAEVIAKVSFEGGCWIWPNTNSSGHPGGGHAHRKVYELFVGPIPEGLELNHDCRVRACVNPDHLTPMSKSANQHLGYKDRTGQMGREDLKVSVWLHDQQTQRLTDAVRQGSI